ncbi:succinate-semialdehyde dehydrogenase / glutarate-semialdehyde dehydrogenase [Halogranum gelatinilyticum]|uniref:Succinate-semialdehyde dehydrogenase / glutarate-semialdehyde dehydrogenase n=1 Tax=Halogranum gelatinilyticum TaxID=660521 RepID=A0A1G9XDA3_9EURY|nr:succinic semialdehyde dehydrogenase [Halogranum gelatinilyticum]SDM94740.1 succinate-semialdehyde dehydrogenase / glutarate-semialdehyde dehydrogenase [Halogranum gelatinilyticum]
MGEHTTGGLSVLSGSGLSARRFEVLAGRVARADGRAVGDNEIDVVAPATDERLGSVPACDETDVAAAVERAREAQADWAARPVEERTAILERFGDLVADRRDDLLDLLQVETGKARTTAVEEVLDVPNACSYYADVAPEALAEERRRGALPGVTTTHVSYDPVGVVGVISPWNYPLTLAVTDAIPALAAGNSVVLKPDEKTPFVALALAELLAEAGLPDGVFQVVTGEGPVVGPALVERVDHVAFTGSTETGRVVAEQAGRNLVGCSLELGGKNPLLVLDDADVERAAAGAAHACFANAGQLCLSIERIYVHESLYAEFLAAFVRETRGLTLGTDLDYAADVGTLASADQLERVECHVADAVETGASVVSGGRHRPDVAPYCYEPTILTDVDADSLVATEETFGPVVSVTPVADTEAAVAAANDSDYGLNASVWTGDRERGRAVARRIESGTVCVNDGYAAGWAALDAPKGGFGDSAVGHRHGVEGIDRYLQTRTVAASRVGLVKFPSGRGAGWVVDGAFTLLGLVRRLQRRLR